MSRFQGYESKKALRDAEKRDLRSAGAGLWWEVVYALKLDRLVEWLASKLRRGGHDG